MQLSCHIFTLLKPMKTDHLSYEKAVLLYFSKKCAKFLFLKDLSILREKKSMQTGGGAERERKSQADSPSTDPNMGLDLTTLRLRVACSMD